MDQRKPRSLRWVLLGAGALIVIAAAFAGLWIYRQFFSPPAVTILQPAGQTMIQLGEGLMLVSRAESQTGLDRVAFSVDGAQQAFHQPPNPGAEEMVAQFPWMPDEAGIYILSVTAYDQRGKSGKEASVPVAVAYPGMALAELQEMEAELSQSPVINSAASGGESSGASAGFPVGEGAVGEGDFQQDGAGNQDEILHVHLDPVREPLEQAVFPPEITLLDVEVAAEGEQAAVTALAEAADDIGVARIAIDAYPAGMEDAVQPAFRVSRSFNSEPACSFITPLPIAPGDYSIVTFAQDTSGLYSEKVKQDIHVPSPEEMQDPEFDPGQAPNLDLPDAWLDEIELANPGEGDQGESAPPFITFFDVLAEGGGSVNISAGAEDDNGIASFSVMVFDEASQAMVNLLSSFCQESLLCDIHKQISLADGSYVLIAQAADTDQNQSESIVRTVQVISNHPGGEPPSVVVGNVSQIIPAEALPHLRQDENGVLRSDPRRIAQEGAGFEVEELDLQEEIDMELPGGEEDRQDPPIVEIEGDTLDYVEVDIWYQPASGGADAQIVMAVRVPPGIPVPESPDPLIRVSMRTHVEYGAQTFYMALRLTPSVQENGAYKEHRVNADGMCGRLDFYVDFIPGGDPAAGASTDNVRLDSMDLAECTAPPARLLSLTAFYGSQDGDIEINWQDDPPPAGSYAPTESYLISRKAFLPDGIRNESITQGFVDYGTFQIHDTDVLPDTVYEYSIRKVGANGLIGQPSNRLNIRTPAAGSFDTVFSSNWQQNR